jgi:PAS domain S-box-containing protein
MPLLGVFLFLQSPATAQIKETRRVLIFNDFGSVSSPGFAAIDQVILAGLEKSPYQIEFYNENLEVTLFSDQASQRKFREWYAVKYHDHKPDLIITAGPASLKFMVEWHEITFPNTPIIFCGSTEEMLDKLKLDSHFTGVWAVAQPEKTLEAALHLQPATKHVVVVGGVAPFDRFNEGIVKKGLRGYESTLDFTYLTDLDVPTLVERLRHLPSNTIVFHTSITQDAVGARFIDASQSVPMVASAANAPVFVLDDVDLGRGSVGGDLLSWAATGQLAAEMAVRIFNGEKPQNIPIAKSANVYMFDWRALQRWGLKEGDLPPGSVVLNRQPNIWQAYKRYILTGLFLLLVQTLLIFALLLQRSKRQRFQAELGESQLRLEGIVKSAMDAVIAINDEQRIVVFNAAAEKMFGCPMGDAIGSSIDRFIPERFHAAHRGHVRHFADTDITTRAMGSIGALWGLRANAEEFPIEASISQTEVNHKKLFTAIIRDVTERKRATEALLSSQATVRESEERFRLVANTAPVMIWMADTSRLCIYFNSPWLEFTGRCLEEELGNGWAEGVHPEDLDRCLQTYTDAFDRRESFQIEYRLRRHDGEYRWIFNHGVPRFNADSSFAGYIGSGIDVTERKHAEEALSTVSRRLIEAHEEERTWIARELHDDINQGLALLAVSLQKLKQDLPASEVQSSRRVEEVCEDISSLGSDIQALSHRLHSSKLEYLGLEAASASFCSELSNQQNVEIDFRSHDIPKELPQEIALCLFRVLQEALHNAVKHSGARRFEVSLTSAVNEIQLSVHDSGVGIDLENAISRHGLGLISMKERLKLVDGQFSIDSNPQYGTTIHARVLLGPRTKSAGAVG